MVFTMKGGFKVGFGCREVVEGVKDLAMVAKFNRWIVGGEFCEKCLNNRKGINIIVSIFQSDVETDGILFVLGGVCSN